MILNETNGEQNAGILAHDGNEITCDSKVLDAAGFRMGAPAGQESLGKLSGDQLVSGSRKEKTLTIFKVAPDGAGYIEFFGQMPGTEDDQGMVRLLTLHPIEGVIVYGSITQRPRGSEYDPPVDTGGPLLDRDMRNNDALYDMFVNRHGEFRSAVADWFLEVQGRAIDTGSMAMLMFRALIERDRWVTLRAALQDAWPKS